MTGGAVNYIFGSGQNTGNNVTGNTDITIAGGSVTMLYGGGNYGSVTGNVNISVTGGTIAYGIVGGCGAGTIGGNTAITISGGTISGNVYGGGWGGAVSGKTTVTVSGGTVSGSIYGGGNAGNVTGSATVYIYADASVGTVSSSGNTGSVGLGSHSEYEIAFYDAKNGIKYTTGDYAPQWITSGLTAVKPAIDPTQSGKAFDSWKKASDDSTFDFTSIITKAEKLYPGWNTIYTVSFDSNGGTAVADLTNVISGSKIVAPTAPTKTGFTFGGWYKDSGLTDDWNFATDTVTANTTLYAKWTANDTTQPTVSSVSVPTNGTYKAGDVLEFTVNFSENVNVTGAPTIYFIIGATAKFADYVSGSGTSALVFRYTVQSGDNDSDGISIQALPLNGGTIKDAAGNDAVLTLNNMPSTTGVLVDAVAPAAPSTPDLDSGSDTGKYNTDNLTKDTTPTFTGTAEAGSTVKLYDGATQIGSATATGGSWTITSSTLSEGTHSITAKSTDAAGNTSVASSALSIEIDITPPTRNDVTDGQIFASPISFLSLGGTAELTKGTDAPVSYTGGVISDNGSYVLKITDTAGNIYSVSFTIAITTVPGVPQNLTVTPGNGKAEVTFDPPADNGGAAITLYRLKIVRVSNNGIQLLFPNLSPYTAVSLINGEEYKFSIAALNIAGQGAYSSEITALIGRTGKSIVSTTVGNLSGGNIVNVPYGTIVSALKSGLTVSDGASAEILTGSGGTVVADQDTTIVTSSMIIRITAENGISAEYTITVNPATYTVSFNSNGGTAVADLTNVISGSKITAPTAPTRSNYSFKGWYKESSLTNVWNFATDTVTSNITLFAKWSYNAPAPTPDPTPTPTEPPTTNPPTDKPTITVKETPQDIPSPDLITVNPVGDPFDKSVEVRLKDDPKVKEEVQKALENSDTKLPENAKVFPLDISMYIKGTDTKVQPKDGTAVEITCPVPKELLLDKDYLFVVCVVDGKLHILPVKIVIKNGVPCAVFTATHFSPYAFVIDKDGKLATLAAGEPTIENSSPLSQHSVIPYIILSLVLIAGIIILKRRKAK